MPEDKIEDLKDNTELFKKREEEEKSETTHLEGAAQQPSIPTFQLAIPETVEFKIRFTRKEGVTVHGQISIPFFNLWMLNAAEDELKAFWFREAQKKGQKVMAIPNLGKNNGRGFGKPKWMR